MQIVAVDRSWLHTFILEPYLEGCELFNMGWKGVDLSIQKHRLSLSRRIICFIQGATLFFPLVNTIVWLAWQTFGAPQKLAEPFDPETNTPSLNPSRIISIFFSLCL